MAAPSVSSWSRSRSPAPSWTEARSRGLVPPPRCTSCGPLVSRGRCSARTFPPLARALEAHGQSHSQQASGFPGQLLWASAWAAAGSGASEGRFAHSLGLSHRVEQCPGWARGPFPEGHAHLRVTAIWTLTLSENSHVVPEELLCPVLRGAGSRQVCRGAQELQEAPCPAWWARGAAHGAKSSA